MQPYFVPVPRHLYGEIAKSTRGCTLLNELQIINKLIHDAKNIQNKESTRRAAFWAIGHIGVYLCMHLHMCVVIWIERERVRVCEINR